MAHDTPLLLETIRIEGGIIHNLPYHQARMNRSREHLFHTFSTIDLASHLEAPDPYVVFRCRVLYGHEIEKIEYIPYTPKPIKHLKIVSSDIEYRYKYAYREPLDALLAAYPDADEVIIEKDGLLTDTTISNLAFYKEGKWYTPRKPLLEGTMREKFLDRGILHLRDIAKTDLSGYTHVALINAMIGFKVLNEFTIE
jgi:4-amino-4-deoxychorismate lyase